MEVALIKLASLLASLSLLTETSCLSLTQKKSASPQVCIEDMCVSAASAANQTISLSFDVADGLPGWPNNVHPGCNATAPVTSRFLLKLTSGGFHGSSALEGVMMSSKRLATLCKGGGWQCEGRDLMKKNGYDTLRNEWNRSDMLRIYSDLWDLQRPVLMDKHTMHQCFTGNDYVESRSDSIIDEDVGIHSATIPKSLAERGVHELDTGYIILWSPYCLRNMSSNFRGMKHYKRRVREMILYEDHIQAHKYFLQKGEPVLVVNFADLIWRPDGTQRRLNNFLPCLGNIDIDYVPRLGIDVFPYNYWKADGSVRLFGASVDPESFGYNVHTGACTRESLTELSPFSDNDVSLYNDYVDYLRSHSW